MMSDPRGKSEIGVIPLGDAIFVDIYDDGARKIKIGDKFLYVLHDTDFGPDTFHKNTSATHKHPGIRPRWARVIATNHKSEKHVKIGDKVFLEELKWSAPCPIPGHFGRKFYRIDLKHVLWIDQDGFTKDEMEKIKTRQTGAWIK